MLTKVLEKRLKILFLLIILIFVGLIGRLTYLQLMNTEKYNTLSEQNRLRLIPVPAPRGEILDRNGTPVVKDRPVFVVSIAYLDDNKTEDMIDKVSGILGMSADDVAKIKKTVIESKLPKYEPIKIMTDVPIDKVTKIEERREELKNVIIDVEPQRQYLFGDFMPHILGYTREIDEKELAQNKDQGYKQGDRFGKAGLEKQYEPFLRGADGAHQVEVNNQGRVIKALGLKEPTAGDNLVLTIDAKYQKAAEQALDNAMATVQKEFHNAKAGSVVMLDVTNGKVLAMASKPGYDPNIFNSSLSQADTDALYRSNPPAAINRAFSGYPPGSTFKMLTAAAGLQSGVITGDTRINDPGSFKLGDTTFNCWQSWGHGSSNVVRALEVSCDVFFYNVGDRAKVENLDKYGEQFGFGKRTGIDLPEDSSGVLPSPAWKDQRYGPPIRKQYDKKAEKIKADYEKRINEAATDKDKKRLTRERDQKLKGNEQLFKLAYYDATWQRYDTINMSIGQGYNQITPIQLANYVATIANGGNRYRPYLVDKITDSNGKVIKEFAPEVMQKVDVSPHNLALIRQGMEEVANGPEGTATNLFANWPIKVAAKTGTAETRTKQKESDNHGLFVAFAPFDNPKVAVAAIVEYGGHGGSSAGLVVRDTLASYFNIPLQKGGAYSPE